MDTAVICEVRILGILGDWRSIFVRSVVVYNDVDLWILRVIFLMDFVGFYAGFGDLGF